MYIFAEENDQLELDFEDNEYEEPEDYYYEEPEEDLWGDG